MKIKVRVAKRRMIGWAFSASSLKLLWAISLLIAQQHPPGNSGPQRPELRASGVASTGLANLVLLAAQPDLCWRLRLWAHVQGPAPQSNGPLQNGSALSAHDGVEGTHP